MANTEIHHYDVPVIRRGSQAVSPKVRFHCASVNSSGVSDSSGTSNRADSDECSDSHHFQKSPSETGYDVPAQKSRLRSKESVFAYEDGVMCLCAPQQDFVEWHYKTTKSVLKNLKSAFDGLNFDDEYPRGSHDGSADSSTTSSTPSREFSRARPREDGEEGSRNYLGRQGATRRATGVITSRAISRPKLRRTPEALTFLCVCVINENVMRCETTFSGLFRIR